MQVPSCPPPEAPPPWEGGIQRGPARSQASRRCPSLIWDGPWQGGDRTSIHPSGHIRVNRGVMSCIEGGQTDTRTVAPSMAGFRLWPGVAAGGTALRVSPDRTPLSKTGRPRRDSRLCRWSWGQKVRAPFRGRVRREGQCPLSQKV